MARTIEDALEVLNALNSQGRIEYADYSELYDAISTIDAKPVKHGKWKVYHKIRLTPENISDPNITLSLDNLELLCDECHECSGAKMDEEEEDEVN